MSDSGSPSRSINTEASSQAKERALTVLPCPIVWDVATYRLAPFVAFVEVSVRYTNLLAIEKRSAAAGSERRAGVSEWKRLARIVLYAALHWSSGVNVGDGIALYHRRMGC